MRSITVTLLALMLAVASTTEAAKPLKSPSAELRAATTMIASGVIGTQESASRLALDQVQAVHGKLAPETSLRLRMPAWLQPHLAVGQRVLVAYTPYRRDPSLVDRRIIDPDGARLIIVGGLEPALFRDDQVTRARLLDASGKPRAPSYEEALAGLADPDPQWQNYYAHELAINAGLRARVDTAAVAEIERLLRDSDANPSARAVWFRAAPLLSGTDPAWWHAAALEVLASTPLQGLDDPSGSVASLVRTVFDALERAAVPVDVAVLARWVSCDLSALGEAALLTARRSAPEREDALIEAALQRTQLTDATRRFLLDHQRRLRLMREALAARPTEASRASTPH